MSVMLLLVVACPKAYCTEAVSPKCIEYLNDGAVRHLVIRFKGHRKFFALLFARVYCSEHAVYRFKRHRYVVHKHLAVNRGGDGDAVSRRSLRGGALWKIHADARKHGECR